VYEVEQKFRVADPVALERRLAAAGVVFQPPREQRDLYFAHPCRDFVVTDEALRLRRSGEDVAITWKGPRIDRATKTRREIELPLAPVAVMADGATAIARWTELLEALGFRRVREVAKRRRPGVVTWAGRAVEVAVDAVAGLGDFVELEVQAAEADVAAARECITALARELGCGESERRSYLELLEAARPDG
jgi:adenylate cyclase class 2